jgi:2-(1,2-epoxy-1,2-dihydrophenyl)acetyl-CoA isomerase
MTTADATQPSVLTATQGAVAIVTLNRPHRMNTIDFPLAEQFLAALQHAAADDSIRAILINGSGRAFMTGADLKLFVDDMDHASQTATGLIDLLHEALRLIRTMPKPVIAALQGAVAGGGLGLALACDLAVAADNAVFLSAYTKIGTSPDAGTTWSLTRLLGPRRAMEVMLLNDPIDAARALSLGLVNSVVPLAELEAAAMATAQRLAEGARGANASVKRLVGEAITGGFSDQLDRERASFAAAAQTADFREGVSAFVARRKPTF